MDGVGVSIVVVVSVSAILMGTGLRKQPGLGVLGAIVIIGLLVRARGEGVAAIGFAAPASWWQTVALALALGVALQLLSIVLVEPLAEKLAGVPHDHSVVPGVKGSWKAFALWMLALIAVGADDAIRRRLRGASG